MRLLSSLTNRIFLATALLAIVSIGVAIYVVNAAVTAQAEAELQRGLQEAGRLVEQYRSMLFEHVTREARLIADLPRFKAIVELDHGPTARPVAGDYRQQLGADLFLVTNRQGDVLADAGDSGLSPDAVAALPAIRAAVEGRETASFWPREGGTLQVVTVPVWIDPEQPEILGTLSVGFSLNEALAARFREFTASEIAFVFEGRVQAATLPPALHDHLSAVPGTAGVTRLVLGNDQYVAMAQSLAPGPALGAAGPAGPAPQAVLLRSRTERLRFLGPLHTALAATALFAVLMAILLSYGVARTVTRPLGIITARMREAAATGNLERTIALPGGGWIDEDARLLASTFNSMTASIGHFQREAAQRERLSSLGRLSTVIAHEIRNPLMIIKTSLRTLRRHDTDPERQRAAVADIEEEIARLNRIVTEVLDFARPIQFDLAPADLNGLCRDAADAAAADAGGGPAVRIETDPSAGEVVTDAERLRLALVNVLVNARQAVQARQPDAGQEDSGGVPPAIALRTAAVGRERVRITVADRGIGIAPEDVPRIFEPYFTTRRTGSGLGLAIARNIVEGLGGTIAARSRPSEGTVIDIELRRAPGVPGSSS